MPEQLLEFPSHPVFVIRRFLIAACAVLAMFILCTSSTALKVSAEGYHELRGDVPKASFLQSQIAALQEIRPRLVDELKQLHTDLGVAMEAAERLSIAEQELTLEIERLQAFTQSMAVNLLLGTLPYSEWDIDTLINTETSVDVKLNQHLLSGVNQIQKLELQLDDNQMDVVVNISYIRSEIERVNSELAAVDLQEAEALELLVLAEAWDRAELAITYGRHGFAPQEKWDALRFCESTNNYAAISSSGKYRGAYQFDLVTWQSVGGSGDPALASPSEQEARARELYALRGASPWPICGRHLQ